jgi:hypothetical protein
MSRDSEVRSKLKEEVFALQSHEYDWNGTGGLPIRPDVFAMLNWLIPSFCFPDDRILFRLGVPQITLNDDGTVDWFWEYHNRSLNIRFLCSGSLKYGRFFEDNSMEVAGVLVNRSLSEINVRASALAQWVCTGVLQDPEVFTK